MNKHKEPTIVFVVNRVLQEADDFMTVHQIMAATGYNVSRVTASLVHLAKYQAAAFIHDAAGLYWYATPATDRRTYQLEEKVMEEPGNRKRRGGKRVIPTVSK